MEKLASTFLLSVFCVAAESRAAEARMVGPFVHLGMCDASAAVAIGRDRIVVANDEDSILRVYSNLHSGAAVQTLDVSGFLAVDRREPETDLEGAARVRDRIYWITSHGRNQNGKRRTSRERFFATEIRGSGDQIELVPAGRAYKDLLRDLVNDSRLRRFSLASASRLAPKEPGALNIEGLCSTPDGRLLIGFRNPVPAGKALLVTLVNPADVVRGSAARFGDPVLLDLGGLGIREIAQREGKYLIVAGAFDGGGRSRLFGWDGHSATVERLLHSPFEHFNPEAVVFSDDEGWNRVFLLSDDGSRRVAGQRCKDIADPGKRRFRSVWVQVGPAGR